MVRPAGLVIISLTMIMAPGCLTPYARYTRPSRQAESAGRTSYKVPGNWDYRKNYQVPASRLKTIVDSYLGIPYRYGGTTRKGMDCSGFVTVVFSQLNHARLPRSSSAMNRLGRSIVRSEARAGDLVFFKGGALRRINHVGIYMGNDRFVHASRKKGVIYSRLDEEYYRARFAGIRRIF